MLFTKLMANAIALENNQEYSIVILLNKLFNG